MLDRGIPAPVYGDWIKGSELGQQRGRKAKQTLRVYTGEVRLGPWDSGRESRFAV